MIIGEAVQNMRSALDLLVYHLAVFAGASKSARKKTQNSPSQPIPAVNSLGALPKPLRGEHRRRIQTSRTKPQETQKTHPLADSVVCRIPTSTVFSWRSPINPENAEFHPELADRRGEYRVNSKGRGLIAYSRNLHARKRSDQGDRGWYNQISRSDPVGRTGSKADEGSTEVGATLKRMLWTVTEIIDGVRARFGRGTHSRPTVPGRSASSPSPDASACPALRSAWEARPFVPARPNLRRMIRWQVLSRVPCPFCQLIEIAVTLGVEGGASPATEIAPLGETRRFLYRERPLPGGLG